MCAKILLHDEVQHELNKSDFQWRLIGCMAEEFVGYTSSSRIIYLYYKERRQLEIFLT
jgi:hypothetical protein